MAKKEKKKKRKEKLDTQTTVANMNVEGFKWFDPKRDDRLKNPPPKLTKKEQRALIRGAYQAMLPMILCIAVGFLAVYLLAYLWLR